MSVHNTARIDSPTGKPYVINGYAMQSSTNPGELEVFFAGHGLAPCLLLLYLTIAICLDC